MENRKSPTKFIECESEPNRDPLIVSVISLTLLVDLKSNGGSNRRRPGPHYYSYFGLEISLLLGFD